MGKATESIYSGSAVIPLADVSHTEKRGIDGGIVVVTKHTTWNQSADDYNNSIYLHKEEAPKFLAAFCRYRSEIESETLADLTPTQPQGDAERLEFLIKEECQVWEVNGRYSLRDVTEAHPATAEYPNARAAIDEAITKQKETPT